MTKDEGTVATREINVIVHVQLPYDIASDDGAAKLIADVRNNKLTVLPAQTLGELAFNAARWKDFDRRMNSRTDKRRMLTTLILQVGVVIFNVALAGYAASALTGSDFSRLVMVANLLIAGFGISNAMTFWRHWRRGY